VSWVLRFVHGTSACWGAVEKKASRGTRDSTIWSDEVMHNDTEVNIDPVLYCSVRVCREFWVRRARRACPSSYTISFCRVWWSCHWERQWQDRRFCHGGPFLSMPSSTLLSACAWVQPVFALCACPNTCGPTTSPRPELVRILYSTLTVMSPYTLQQPSCG